MLPLLKVTPEIPSQVFDSRLTANHVFILTLILILAWVTMEIIKYRRDKSKTERLEIGTLSLQAILANYNQDTIELLREISESTSCKLQDRLSLNSVNATIETSYIRSCLEITAMLIKIYTDNNVDNPDRKREITDTIYSTIKNCYQRDSQYLSNLKYKGKRLNVYMLAEVQHVKLSDGIYARLYENRVTQQDMCRYLHRCFEMYVNTSKSYFESL
jgi:hypothetical protein